MSYTVPKSGPATIELVTVVDVDTLRYTVDVRSESSSKPIIYGVPYAVPYTGPGGAGINVIPEAGALCYLLETADGSRTILGFVQPPTADGTEVTYSGGRPPRERGDIDLGTVDGNFIRVLRGGVVQIYSSALAQRVHIPTINLIRDIFARYEALSPIGEVRWLHTDVTSATGRAGSAVIVHRVKQKTSDTTAVDRLFKIDVASGDLSAAALALINRPAHRFGQASEDLPVPEGTTGVFSMLVSDESGVRGLFVLQLDEQGNMLLRAANFSAAFRSVHVAIGSTAKVTFPNGEISISEAGNVSVAAGGANSLLSIAADGSVVVSAKILTINIGGVTLSLSDGSANIDGNVVLGDPAAAAPAILDKLGLLEALLNHEHDSPSGPVMRSAKLASLSASMNVLKSSKTIME